VAARRAATGTFGVPIGTHAGWFSARLCQAVADGLLSRLDTCHADMLAIGQASNKTRAF